MAPSGKPRVHRGKGRPRKDKAYTRDLELEIHRLRALHTEKLRNTDLWKAIENVVAIAETLEDQTYAISSPTWNSSGHAAETPLFAGIHMAPAPGDPGYDEQQHKGNRELYHSGKHAQALLNNLTRNVEWAAQRARERLVLRQAPVKPREPKLDEPDDCEACEVARG